MGLGTVYVALSEFCKYGNEPQQILLEAGFRVQENRSGQRLRREQLFEALYDVDAVLAGVEPYDAELLASLPSLRCISRCGVGTDAIDLETAERLNIAVKTTPDEVVEPVAEMTVGMILALARNFPFHYADFRKKLWRKHTGFLISEWTIGLIGFGRIGRKVEQYLRPFRPRIIIADPNVRLNELPDGVQLRDLATLLCDSDLVSLHADRRPEQGALLGKNEICLMKRGSRMVNTGRGHLVDEDALFEALECGHLSAAAIDVFKTEPYHGPLSTLPQVLCTPHVASLTRASRVAMEFRCAKNVVSFFAENSPFWKGELSLQARQTDKVTSKSS